MEEHSTSPIVETSNARRLLGSYVSVAGLALCVASLFDLGMALEVDGIPFGSLLVLAGVVLAWNGPSMGAALARSLGFLAVYSGLLLLAVAPFASHADPTLPWRGIPIAIALLAAGVYLRVANRTSEERAEMQRRRASRASELASEWSQSRARIVMAEPHSGPTAGDLTVTVEMIIDEGGGRPIQTRLEVPVIYVPRIVPGAGMPIRVRVDDPDKVEVDWQLWNDELRQVPPAD